MYIVQLIHVCPRHFFYLKLLKKLKVRSAIAIAEKKNHWLYMIDHFM